MAALTLRDAPAGDDTFFPRPRVAVRQTDGLDVFVVGDRPVQLNQSDVVLVRLSVVLAVNDELFDWDKLHEFGLFICLPRPLVASHLHGQIFLSPQRVATTKRLYGTSRF